MNNNVDTGKSAEGSYLPLLGGSAGKILHPDAKEFSSSASPFLREDPKSDSCPEDPLDQKTSVAEKLAREILANEALAREILANEGLAREILAGGSRSRHITTQEILVDERIGALNMVGRFSPEETAAEEVASNLLPDLVCLSHLRWDFVYQRPQHLMSRSACERRVFFVEEPVFGAPAARLEISQRDCGVVVVVPHLPEGLSEADIAVTQQSLLLDELFQTHNISDYILWYYTPMALAFTWHLEPLAIVYDCMDELSAFKFAPQNLKQREAELLACADVVFTGGYSLYEAKRQLHANIHPFPSSIDTAHFRKARIGPADPLDQPPDQIDIPHPRLGFIGVIDERMDQTLLAGIADSRPDWQLVIIGPVVKIDPAELPQRPNIHYLGGKDYRDLPSYLAGWDIAMLPFARNESTRYISPTKTPEYLAAGVPTISTSIRDVVHPYGQQGIVKIADMPAEFIAAAEHFMSPGIKFDYDAWLKQVDETLASNSWDSTWARMMQLIDLTVKNRYPDMFVTKPMAASAGLSTSFTTTSRIVGSPFPGD